MKLFLFLALFLLLTGIQSIPAQDTVRVANTSAHIAIANDADDGLIRESNFLTFLLIVAVIALSVAAICIIAGIILAGIVILVIAGCISAGILAASVFVGMYRRSFSSGFKTFVVAGSTIIAVMVMACLFAFFGYINRWWSPERGLFMGSIAGVIVGPLFGLTMVFVLRRTTSYLFRKYSGINKKPLD